MSLTRRDLTKSAIAIDLVRILLMALLDPYLYFLSSLVNLTFSSTVAFLTVLRLTASEQQIEPTMQILVRSLEETYAVSVNPNGDLNELKAAIEDREFVPPTIQRIVKDGQTP